MASSWRTLARSYEFQGSLGRFVSFNKERQNAFPSIPANNPQTLLPAEQHKTRVALVWLPRERGRIRLFSVAALVFALAAVALVSFLGLAGGGAWRFLRFAISLPAILATGLLAGIPAALRATIASVL